MSNNLKIEVLVEDIPESGAVVSQFPTQEYVDQQLNKKAGLTPEGRLNPSQSPDYTEIPGLYEHIEDTKEEITTSISDALNNAKGYTNQQLSANLQNKADLVNGKIPFDQIPFSSNIEEQIVINVENITAVVDQKVAQVVGQVNEATTAANAYTDEKFTENKDYIDSVLSNVMEDVVEVGVSKSLTIPTYLTPEAGVAEGTGVAAGAYFNVRSGDDKAVAVEYQNVSGSPEVTGKSYPSSSFVQDVRVKAPYFFNTVSAMVTANNISDGMIVGTKGYHNVFDDGGAIYLISSTSTNYSIPLANGLHAVFRDTFDIRKFGVQNNKTLDQTDYFQRLVNYADSRVYEIDFHNYEFMTPKIWTWISTRGVLANQTTPITNSTSQVMGLPFHHCHKLKNFKIANDKTTRLNTSHCQIIFAPLENPLNDQWFELENVTFDPWVDNYQPYSENYLGNYDGMRHGLFCHPAKDSTLPQWGIEPSNINFKFTNVHFESSAYSYNLTTSSIHAKIVEFENLTGEYTGLYLNYSAQRLIGKQLRAFRDRTKLENGRVMVGNAIHYEGEYTGKTLAFERVELEDIAAFDKQTGVTASTYAYKNLGTTSLQNFILKRNQGHVRLEGVSCDSVLIEDSNNYSSFVLLNLPKCDYLRLERCETSNNPGSFGSAPMLLRSSVFGKIELVDCDLNYPLYISSAAFSVTVNELILKDVRVLDNTNGIIRGAFVRINKFIAERITVNSPSGRLVEADLGEVSIDGVRAPTDSGSTLIYLVRNRNTTVPAKVTVKDLVTSRTNAQYDSVFDGLMDLTLTDSYLAARPKLGTGVSLTEFNVYPRISGSKTFDPPSLTASGTAGASATTTVTATGVKLGDFIQVSFTQYHADIEISAVVSAANTVTVKFKNTGASPVDLPSGTLAVIKA